MQIQTAAASLAVEPVLSGPSREVTVTAALPTALYLATDDPEHPAMCLVGADSVRPPCALVLSAGIPTGGSRRRETGLGRFKVGERGTAGDGVVVLDGLAVRVTRWWRPPRPRGLSAAGSARLRASAAELAAALEGDRASGDAIVAALSGDDDTLDDAVGGLVGRGAGLTPLGDDVLAGMLVTLRALAHADADRLASAVAAVPVRRTTTVSAALMHHAALGECVPELAALLAAVRHGYPLPLADVRALGHTSGAGLLHGVLAGLIAAGYPPADRQPA